MTTLSEQREALSRIRQALRDMVATTYIHRASEYLSDAQDEVAAHFTGAARNTITRNTHQSDTDMFLYRIADSLFDEGEGQIYCERTRCNVVLPRGQMLEANEWGSPQWVCPHCATDAYDASWSSRSFIWSEPEPEYDDEDDVDVDDRYSNGYLLDCSTSPSHHIGVSKLLMPGEVAKPGTRFFGFEIECIVPDIRENIRKLSRTNLVKAAIMKSDGSLGSSGMEVCTLPMTRNAALKHLKVISDELIGVQARAWNRNQCGLHIHVSTASASWGTWGKVDRFFQNTDNQRLLDLVAGRPANQYCNRKQTPYIAAHKITEAKKKTRSDRYQALNFSTGKPTVEFRLFRGNVSYEGLVRCMQFCDSLIEWASEQSISSQMHSLAYVQWLYQNRGRYPILVKYLRVGQLQQEEAA